MQNVVKSFPNMSGVPELYKDLPKSLDRIQKLVNDPEVRTAAKLEADAIPSPNLLGFSWAFHRDIIGSGFDFGENELFNTSTLNINQEYHIFTFKKLPAMAHLAGDIASFVFMQSFHDSFFTQ